MKNHLKGLDTLRALAALTVVWGHIELFKKNKGLPNLLDNPIIHLPSGRMAVILFFVISGFLITYLLVKEQTNNESISFKKFYLRRILRIWPLYYTILLLSFLLFRVEYSGTTLALCFSIFPNIAHTLGVGWPSSPQIWSIGVEEQFYLFWPLLLTVIPEKRIPLVLILFFIGYSLCPIAFKIINYKTLHNQELGTIVDGFFYTTKFNCMSIGALIGFLYAKKSRCINYMSNNSVAILSIGIALFFWCYGVTFNYLTEEIYSIIFSFAILNIVNNPNIKIDNGVTRFVGTISYGIYMYHWIIILLTEKYVPMSENITLFNITLYTIVVIGTILISWLSYISLEKYFLEIKTRYET